MIRADPAWYAHISVGAVEFVVGGLWGEFEGHEDEIVPVYKLLNAIILACVAEGVTVSGYTTKSLPQL
jgi:hypothetical protein